MQVKKFEAPTIAEAIKLVKSELGPEAIILSTKNHKKGFGLLSKASVEVTAAVADKSLAKKQVTEKLVPPSTKEQLGKLPASKQTKIFNEFSDYVDRRKEERKPKTRYAEEDDGFYDDDPRAAQRAQANRAGPPRYNSAIDNDEEEGAGGYAGGYARNGRIGNQVKNAVAATQPKEQSLYDGYQSVKSAPAQAAVSASAPQAASMSSSMHTMRAAETEVEAEVVVSLQEDIQRLKLMIEELKSEQTLLSDTKIAESSTDELQGEFNNLLRNGIDKRYAAALIKQVSFALSREKLKSQEEIIEALAVELMANMKIDHPLDLRPGDERKVFALVGPTGVGKTTTIAKLASQAILNRNLRVGLINVDTYKVAALDQLATYAKILNVPFRSATNAMELDRALTEFKPLDLILIDTSGRSQRDSESLSQMKALLAENTEIRPLLIMSATTRDQDLYDITTRFKIFNPTGVVFSKLDETATFGSIYNISQRTGLPLTYFTVGQRVPEDIEPATKERVASLILDL